MTVKNVLIVGFNWWFSWSFILFHTNSVWKPGPICYLSMPYVTVWETKNVLKGIFLISQIRQQPAFKPNISTGRSVQLCSLSSLKCVMSTLHCADIFILLKDPLVDNIKKKKKKLLDFWSEWHMEYWGLGLADTKELVNEASCFLLFYDLMYINTLST